MDYFKQRERINSSSAANTEVTCWKSQAFILKNYISSSVTSAIIFCDHNTEVCTQSYCPVYYCFSFRYMFLCVPMYINTHTHLYMNLCTYDQFLYPGKIAKPLDHKCLGNFLILTYSGKMKPVSLVAERMMSGSIGLKLEVGVSLRAAQKGISDPFDLQRR